MGLFNERNTDMRKLTSNHLNKVTKIIVDETLKTLSSIFKQLSKYPKCKTILLYHDPILKRCKKYFNKLVPKNSKDINCCSVQLNLPRRIINNTSLDIKIKLNSKNYNYLIIDGVYTYKNEIVFNVDLRREPLRIKQIESSLSMCIRHELEHLHQSHRKKAPKIAYQDTDSTSGKLSNIKKYLLSPNEVEAYVVGLAYEARLKRCSLIELIENEIYNFVFSSTGRKKDKECSYLQIRNKWKKYAVKRKFKIF